MSPEVHDARHALASNLEKLLAKDKNWYEFPTPQHYRDARRSGTNGFKEPVLNEAARSVTFTGRDGNSIELRVIKPKTGPSKGVWLHFHAGKYVLKYRIAKADHRRWFRDRKQCLI